MVAKWIETLTGSLEQKKQYRQDKARIDSLPKPYGQSAKALHRYLMYCGKQWIDKERARRTSAIADAQREEQR